MMMWSIWLMVLPSGDCHVSLWMFLCGKMVPPMTKLLFVQKLTRRSPLLFLSPHPYMPIALSLLELSFPTLAFMSPVRRRTSCWGTFEFEPLNCHLQLFIPVFFDLLLSLVGWCIDGEFTKLWVEAYSDQPFTYWFPLQQGFGLLFGD